MKLNEIIARARKAKGLTLRDLEKITSISNPLLSQIETGVVREPGFRKVVIIADSLGIPMNKIWRAE